MHRLTLSVLLFVPAAVALLSGGTSAPDRPARGVPASAEPARHQQERTDEPFAFLAGRWTADDGGLAEEVWSAPAHGLSMGMFRWLRPDGSVMVYELLTIGPEDGQTLLRLRHFDSTLAPWASEAEGPMRFRLAEHSATKLVWQYSGDDGKMERYEQELVAPDLLRSTLVFPEGAGRAPVVLVKTRAG